MRRIAVPFPCLTLFLLAIILVISEVGLWADNTPGHGQIIIPEEIFPEGRHLPIPIHLPPVVNGSNAFFDDWQSVKEISGDKIRFSSEKLLEGIAQMSLTRVSEGEAAAMVLGAGLFKIFTQAFEEEAFKITIQKNAQGSFRVIIQILTDEGNVLRSEAGGGINSPSTGITGILASNWLRDKFALPEGTYQATWLIDRRHKQDPYVAYLSLYPSKNVVVITPKIYSGDKFRIHKIIAGLWPQPVLELTGQNYLNFWSYLLPIQTSEALRVLELIGISQKVAEEAKNQILKALVGWHDNPTSEQIGNLKILKGYISSGQTKIILIPTAEVLPGKEYPENIRPYSSPDQALKNKEIKLFNTKQMLAVIDERIRRSKPPYARRDDDIGRLTDSFDSWIWSELFSRIPGIQPKQTGQAEWSWKIGKGRMGAGLSDRIKLRKEKDGWKLTELQIAITRYN